MCYVVAARPQVWLRFGAGAIAMLNRQQICHHPRAWALAVPFRLYVPPDWLDFALGRWRKIEPGPVPETEPCEAHGPGMSLPAVQQRGS